MGVWLAEQFNKGPRQRVADQKNTGQNAGAIYANYQFNQPQAVLLEDSYVNNNGALHGRPKFAGGSVVFNGTDQYATAPEGITDFGGLTIDMMIDRVAGGTLFDFGTGDDECFYLRIDASSGKAILGARHAGKSFSISSSHSIPAGKPTRLRIEMNSSTAAIHIDGKPAVTGKFAFSPRDVFIGDRAEGNFIAASRAQKDFYKGKIDHFRVYRQVHKDFDALGAIPFPLTQAPDWSPEDQKKADDWDARKKAKEAELKAGEYGKMLGQIKKLNSQKSELYRAKSKELQNLETLAREASKAKSNLDRKIRDKVNDRLKTVKDEQQKKDLRKQIETQNRATKQYAAAVAKRQAAEQALRVGRENNRKRIEREMSKELTRIATDIAKLQSDSKAMRENALKDAGLSGRNPHPGQRQAEQQAKYKLFTYHATADWSGVVHDDRRQPEHLAPPKMRAWLKRVRGY